MPLAVSMVVVLNKCALVSMTRKATSFSQYVVILPIIHTYSVSLKIGQRHLVHFQEQGGGSLCNYIIAPPK